MISQTVDGIATINAQCIVAGGYGGYDVDNGQFWYYMVKWVCEPWQVNKDQIVTVENVEYSLLKMSGFAVVCGWTLYLQQRSIGS